MFSPTSSNVFSVPTKPTVPDWADIIFVSDIFLDQYVGGAELTSEAIIRASPHRVFKLKSSDVTMETLQQGQGKHWIFGNFAGVNPQLIPTIVTNMKYSVIEYDYKFCKYRSIEKHLEAEGQPCNCAQEMTGKLISAFMYGAMSLWWMSEKQLERYTERFPFLTEKKNTVLSSVFDTEFFATINLLNEQAKTQPKAGWIVIGSPSWIKGTQEAIDWCESQGLVLKDSTRDATSPMMTNEYEVVWNVPYFDLLQKLSRAEGLVFLPKGADTCPRLVIEAKLLGCKLHLNDNVQHKDEIWFNTEDTMDTLSYLFMSTSRFWEGIRADMVYVPKISGYTTTKDCIKQSYPFRASIESMLGFCSQVVVVDGGSKDGTWEELQEWAAKEPRLLIHQENLDWNSPRFALFDGQQKAKARSLCTEEFCWQQDSDEVVHEDDYEKIPQLARQLPNNICLLSLPVIEYWGGPSKVRMDIFPWKWRLSRNVLGITHGVPGHLRVQEEGGYYSKPGTDGCDYIFEQTLEPVPHASFYTNDVEKLRQMSMGSAEALRAYGNWVTNVVNSLPSVHHYSWFNIGRKIRTYRDYWSKHWQSLYNIVQEDTPENNMFFDSTWTEVSEEQIDDLATRLAMEMGGWIFHSKVDFKQRTPFLKPVKSHPVTMAAWMQANRPQLRSTLEELRETLSRLLTVKGDDNWQSVRDAEVKFTLCREDTSVGVRSVYRLQSDQQVYEDLQQSRGLTIASGDTVENFVQRAVDEMDVLYDSDLVRIDEIDALLGRTPTSFGEVGFRVPRLQRYFESRGCRDTYGYDVADISVLFAHGMGYSAGKYDLNLCLDPLDVSQTELVVCYHVLEHVSDPECALQTIFDGMNSGCFLHVEIPIERDSPNLQVAHLFGFHPGDLATMLTNVGFQVKHVSTKGHQGSSPIERCWAVKP